MYQVIFSKQALKSLKRIPTGYQVKIKASSEKLSINPFILDIRKLDPKYNATHRLRIGDYRLFLQIDTASKIIKIAEIERRTTQTYR